MAWFSHDTRFEKSDPNHRTTDDSFIIKNHQISHRLTQISHKPIERTINRAAPLLGNSTVLYQCDKYSDRKVGDFNSVETTRNRRQWSSVSMISRAPAPCVDIISISHWLVLISRQRLSNFAVVVFIKKSRNLKMLCNIRILLSYSKVTIVKILNLLYLLKLLKFKTETDFYHCWLQYYRFNRLLYIYWMSLKLTLLVSVSHTSWTVHHELRAITIIVN